MPEFTFKKYDTDSSRAITYKVEQQERALSFKEVIDLLVNSSPFRTELTDILKESEFDGFFWEVKPCTKGTIEQEFEFATVYGRRISEITMDSEPFKEYFNEEQTTLSFKNLKGDAQLIVPNRLKPSNMSIFKRLFKTDKEPVPEEIVMKAIYDNDINSFKNCIKQFTTEQIKLNSNPDEFSALHVACSEGRPEIAELILTEPISETPNLSRVNNFYPIHACAMNGHKRTVELLIQKGADINVQTDPQLYSPLHSASFAGHLEIVKLLVKHGANTNLKNYRDELPIDTAKRQNETDVVEFLKKA